MYTTVVYISALSLRYVLYVHMLIDFAKLLCCLCLLYLLVLSLSFSHMYVYISFPPALSFSHTHMYTHYPSLPPLSLLSLQSEVGDASHVAASQKALHLTQEEAETEPEEAADSQCPLQREPAPTHGETLRRFSTLCQVSTSQHLYRLAMHKVWILTILGFCICPKSAGA